MNNTTVRIEIADKVEKTINDKYQIRWEEGKQGIREITCSTFEFDTQGVKVALEKIGFLVENNPKMFRKITIR